MTARAYTIENGRLPNNLSKDKAGDLIVMLKSALTTGYNAKPHAGWKLVYDSITNSNDTVRRAVFQSQSPSSEQRYYEIVDNVAQNATLTMYERWDSVALKGGGRSVSLKIYGSNGNHNGSGVIANECFVYFVWASKLYWFGDYDEFELVDKSIIFGQTDTNLESLTIPSLYNNTAVVSRTIRDINNTALVLRNEPKKQFVGWSNIIDYVNNQGVFYSPATARLFAKPVDILQMVGDKAIYRGTLPMMMFCNRMPSPTDIAENGKKIYADSSSYSGTLFYLVDEL